MDPGWDLMETDAFRLLAQGMKDREAYRIVAALAAAGASTAFDQESPFEIFERWAKETLADQAKQDGL